MITLQLYQKVVPHNDTIITGHNINEGTLANLWPEYYIYYKTDNDSMVLPCPRHMQLIIFGTTVSSAGTSNSQNGLESQLTRQCGHIYPLVSLPDTYVIQYKASEG